MRNLGTRLIGQRVLCYPRVTSTMELAKREARRGTVAGTVVVTEEQTAGRGRMKRIWLSPRGSLALSIILYPSVIHLPSLIMLASLAVVRSIGTVTGLKAQIKWPNDVLINGKKVCGVLIESAVRGNRVDYAAIGIGMNVNLKPTDFPEIMHQTTSLSDELGRDVSLVDITRRLLLEADGLYLSLPAGESLYEEWRDNLETLGKEVRVVSGQARYDGIAESVNRDGSLMLRHSDGTLSQIVAGDVTLRNVT